MKKKLVFHESLDRKEEIALPSEQSFARVMAGAFAVFACISYWHHREIEFHVIILVVIAALFLTVGYTRPLALRPLNKLWMRFGALLYTVVNPLVMLVMFTVTIVPIGLLMRACGKDPLKRKFDKDASSYWVVREIPGPPPETMKNQF